MRFLLAAFLTLAAILPLAMLGPAMRPAAAQDAMKIVAVVNDDIVTELDLVQRLRLAMIASKLPDTEEVRQRLTPVVLRSLIDERLKAQEIRRNGLSLDEEQLQERLKAIAADNKMSLEEFTATLNASGISIDTVAEQIRTEITWVRLLRERFAGSIRPSDEDIDNEMRRLAAAKGVAEYRLHQIFLPVSGDDAAQRRAAEQIVDEIAAGADFGALADQFSQEQAAGSGGDAGWVTADQLDPAITAALDELTIGAVSRPIRAAGGYYILRLDDKRSAGGEAGAPAPSRDQVAQDLAVKRLQTLSRGYLSDLRRAAVIDIRQ